jgi:hypothetical protein
VEILGRFETVFRRSRRGWHPRERYSRPEVMQGKHLPLGRPPGISATSRYVVWQTGSWNPPGTLAEEAYRAWRKTKGNPSAAILSTLVRRAALSSRQGQVVGRALSRIRWVDTVPEDPKSIWMAWHVMGRLEDRLSPPRYPMAAVLLSERLGKGPGFLRPCSRCGGPFVALPRTRLICRTCHAEKKDAQGRQREADWRRVRDRLRKGHHPATRALQPKERQQVIQAARQELWEKKKPLHAWRRQWDRKDPLGRGRPRRSLSR